VLNTHWHGDHVGGNENLGKAGALIVAHENVRERMSTEQFLEALNQKVPASPEVALPVVTFDDSVTFHLNGDEIHAFHVPPAHTDGDSVVYFREADAVHMGDVFFQSGYPFVDLSSGGSAPGVLDAVERVLGMIGEKTRVIPGHGELTDRDGLEEYRDMLKTVIGRVSAMKAEGKSLEEVQAAKPTEELDERWGGGFIDADRFVASIYESL
jgi:glyoxylase-like metal-dependent hydrolase (beta-lactamase superfamily II)